MKNNIIIKLLCIILSISLIIGTIAIVDFSAYALSSSGSCGDNVTYTFDSSTGELTISGTGAMTNYGYSTSPFYNQSGIKSVVINSGVTSIGNYAFYGCTGLTSITIPDSVTSIGDRAFESCTGLTSIKIPDSVTSIGSYAFEGVNNIEYNGLANGSPWMAKSVNGYVEGYLVYKDSSKNELLGCSSQAVQVTIPDSVISIGINAFRDCTGLTSITIPDSVTSIGDYAFPGCTGLTSVTIGNSVTSIGNYAFDYCKGLTSVTIPDSVTSIGDYAFSSCTGLTSVTIPNSVTSIGRYAFCYCYGLTSVTIGNSVTSIGNYAFEYCTGLKSITIPDSVTSIGSDAFYNCEGLTSISVNSSNNYYASQDGVLYNKNKTTLIQYPIGNNRTSFKIPDSVTSIGGYAFYNCTGLKSVTIPDSVTSIGGYAFYDCTGIKELTMPASAKIYNGSSTFYNCSNIEKVTLTKGTGIMQNYESITPSSSSTYTDHEYTPWYISRYSIKEIVIEDGVTSIGYDAFRGCTGLKSVTIPESVTSIGHGAFEACEGLTSVTIPNSVTSIGYYAFEYCTSLTSVTIPNSVTSIGYQAFFGCTSLTSINVNSSNNYYASQDGVLYNKNKIRLIQYPIGNNRTSFKIPDSVTSIDCNAFRGCTGLKSVTIPDSVISIGDVAFAECSGLTNITMGNGVTSIGSSAFRDTEYYNNESNWVNNVLYVGNCLIEANNSLFGEYIIKEGTLCIGNNAFYNCDGLTSVTIPDSVKSIGSSAFIGCTGLTSITMGNGVTSIGSSAFRDTEYYNNESNWVNNVLYVGNCLIEANNSLFGEYTIKEGTLYIGSNAFCNCESLTSVTIPDSVKSIDCNAFGGCTGLTSVTMGNGVTSIGNGAFNGCTGLTRVNINSIESWCNILFSDTHINPSSNPIYYTHNLYLNDELLTDLIIPDSVTSIGDHAFEDCRSLKKVTIGSSVTNIGKEAFGNCYNLDKLIINKSLTRVEKNAFSCAGVFVIRDDGPDIGDGMRVYYTGSSDEWDQIDIVVDEKDCGNTSLINAKKYYNYIIPCDIHTIETLEAVSPTCTETGLTEGEQCSVCKEILIAQETIDALGHTPAEAVAENRVEPTCTEDGSYDEVVYCLACNVELNRTAKTIDKLNHKYSSKIIAPTCTEQGYTTYTCDRGDHTYNADYVKALGHTEVVDEAVAATCTKTGKTQGSHCSVCGTVITAQKTVAKKAHTYKTYTTKATTSKNGSVVTKCTVCGVVKSKSTIYYPKTVTLSATSYTYDGKVKKPSVKVVGSNGKTISSSNYTVSYASGRKNVGKYAVKITFKGNYSGTKTLYFTINPKSTSISSLSAGSKKFTVKWKKQATQTTGYQIQYSTSSKFTNAKNIMIGKNSTTSKTISKLLGKKKYYVRIRTYKTVSGTKYYSSWSAKKYVTTKK